MSFIFSVSVIFGFYVTSVFRRWISIDSVFEVDRPDLYLMAPMYPLLINNCPKHVVLVQVGNAYDNLSKLHTVLFHHAVKADCCKIH